MNWELIEQKAKHSIDLTEEEAKWLLELNRPDDLAHLYDLAGEVNDRLNGRNVSFIHNMNVNYTNICEYHCTFCEFKKSPLSKDAYILSFDDVRKRIGESDGTLSEITFQGGLSAEVKFKEVLTLLRQLRNEYPHIHFHAFSPEEIDFYASETDQTYLEIVVQAKAAGMNSMCGTAAEVLDDEVRKKICWEKISSNEWCEIIKTAHRLGMHSTATILFGHIETPQHVVNHFKKIRELQRQSVKRWSARRETKMIPPPALDPIPLPVYAPKAHWPFRPKTGSGTKGHLSRKGPPSAEKAGGGMITEFIPLLFMPDKTKLGRMINPSLDRTEYAFKMVAVSRLYFMNDIRNIQTSWVKLGWENALKSLSYGANDMSGTLYHENITREAGGENGEYTPREKFISEISRIGKIPVERDTIYSFQRKSASSLHEVPRALHSS